MINKLQKSTHIGGGSSRIGLVVLCVLLVVLFQSAVGDFATANNLVATLTNITSVLIAAIAMARLVVAGEVDLSVGGMYALIAVITGFTVQATQNPVLGVTSGLFSGLVLGLINGALVLRLQISPIIVTLGLAGVYGGLALVLTNAIPVTGFPPSFTAIGRYVIFGVPIPIIVALSVFILGSIALTKTVGGVRSYAIGGDRKATTMMGIRFDKHVLSLYAYMGVSMGLVALLSAAQLGSASPLLGTKFEFNVLTAVVLGGIAFNGGAGRPLGVLFGVLTIGILESGMIYIGLSDYWRTVVSGGILLIALVADQINEKWRDRVKAVADNAERKVLEGELVDPAELRPHIPPGPVALEARALTKHYGAVTAVQDVNVKVHAGQVMCLLGDNGAGKSTLIKMLAGVVTPSSGEIILGQGTRLNGMDASQVRHHGIETVFQDLAVCPNLGAAVNLSLGREPRRGRLGSLSLFDKASSVKEARQRMASLGVELDDYLKPVRLLSGGQRQCVAISRAIVNDVKVVILDEPTAALGVRQKALVLRLARRLADQGTAVIIITHDVESVKQVADHIVVLSLGRVSFEGPADSVTARDLVHLMAGFALEPQQPEHQSIQAGKHSPTMA